MDFTCLSNLQFRTSPVDECIIQYSTNGGETWDTVWNAAKCMTRQGSLPIVTVNNYNDIRQTITDNRATYNHLIINLYPNWEYESGGDDDHRDSALCYIARTYVNAICDTAIAAAEHSLVEDAWGVIKSIASGIKYGYEVFLTLIDDLGDWAIVPAVATAIGKAGWGIYDTLKGVNVDHFRDTAARNEVICAIWCAMKGDTPSFSTWRDSLDMFNGSENADEIADVIKLMLADEDSFMELFYSFGDVIEVSKQGVDLGCPCDPADCLNWWCREFDFAEGEGNLQGWDLQWGTSEPYGLHSELYSDEFRVGAKWQVDGATITESRIEAAYNGGGSNPRINITLYDVLNNVLAVYEHTLAESRTWYPLQPEEPIANVDRVSFIVRVAGTESISVTVYAADVTGASAIEPTDGAPCP